MLYGYFYSDKEHIVMEKTLVALCQTNNNKVTSQRLSRDTPLQSYHPREHEHRSSLSANTKLLCMCFKPEYSLVCVELCLIGLEQSYTVDHILQ